MKPAIFLSLILTTALSAALLAQAPSAPPGQQPSVAAKSDEKPAEAFVVESLRTVIRFENNGTGTRETTLTARVVSEAGVKQLGLLSFGYSSANEDLTFPYVRVRKADGTVVSTPPDYVQDTTSQITREAPMFTDYHEKHVTVRGLAVGDRLEYQALDRTHTPFVPGQFWTSYDFDKTSTVLDEELEVNVPADRYVKVKSPEVQPSVREEGGRRIYTWKTSHQGAASNEPDTDDAKPSVQVSTFRSWEEVGRWWSALEQEQAVPTPELRAKALELTKDAKTDTEKVQALYNYVSLNFRYVSISFGIGRFQPHAADDVFKNAYGDCKDKETLLAALLKAVGIEADSVLISINTKLDPEVPSPGQFDHVIGHVRLASGPVWLDTTAEVGPFGYLIFPLRDKQALVIRPDQTAVLMTTPADPPFRSSQHLELHGKIGEDATLEADLNWTFRDDSEVVLRAAFRNTPPDKWADLVQRVSYALGYGGGVTEVHVSPPEATASPLTISYHYTRKDFPDWPNKRILTALPPFGLPVLSDKPEDSSKPVELGQPTEVSYRSTLELPKRYRAQLAAPVDLKKDFAEYHSDEQFKDGALIVERRLVTRMRQVPASERAAYKAFWKTVSDEWNSYTDLDNGTGPVLAAKPPDPKAAKLFNEAREALMKSDWDGAMEDLEGAVKLDPSYEQAWAVLASLKVGRQPREAKDAILKALALSPPDIQPFKLMALQLMGLHHEQEAMEVWRALLKQNPDDGDAHANLGNLLRDQKQYQEAVAEYEAAVKLQPGKPDLEADLGFALLELSDTGKAMAAFNESIKVKADPLNLNNIAWALAEKGVHLAEAEQWAVQAVDAEEAESALISTDSLSQSDLRCMGRLAAFWDTLGWVYFKESKLDLAQAYLDASWNLYQRGSTGEHLAQVYARQGKKAAAAHQLALASTLPDSSSSSQPTPLLRRRDGSYAIPTPVRGLDPAAELSEMRRVKLGKLQAASGSAEFWVLFGAGSRIEQVKFISGDERLKRFTANIQNAKFKAPLPDDHPARLLRRGVMVCSGTAFGCDFTLFTLDTVTLTD